MTTLFTASDIDDQEFVRTLRKKFITAMSDGDTPPTGYDAERYLTALKDYEESTFKKAALKIRGAAVVSQDTSNALLASLLNKITSPQALDVTPVKELDEEAYTLPNGLDTKEVLPGEDRIGSPSEDLYDEIFGAEPSGDM